MGFKFHRTVTHNLKIDCYLLRIYIWWTSLLKTVRSCLRFWPSLREHSFWYFWKNIYCILCIICIIIYIYTVNYFKQSVQWDFNISETQWLPWNLPSIAASKRGATWCCDMVRRRGESSEENMALAASGSWQSEKMGKPENFVENEMNWIWITIFF